jgi:hypothetical protein
MKIDEHELEVTPAEACRALEVTKSTLRRWERAGKIVSRLNEKGVHLYLVRDVQRLSGNSRAVAPIPKSRAVSIDVTDGDLAAEVFEGLEAGKSPIELVIALRRPPEVIEPIVRRHARMKGSFIMTPDVLDMIAKLRGWEGDVPIDGSAEFIAGLETALSAAGKCLHCRKHEADYCNRCRRDAIVEARLQGAAAAKRVSLAASRQPSAGADSRRPGTDVQREDQRGREPPPPTRGT